MKLTCGFLFFMFLSISIHASSLSVSDSLLTEGHIRSLQIEYPDSALYLLDISEQRQLPGMELFKIDILRCICYGHKGAYRAQERYARRVLQNDSVKLVPRRRLTVVSMLASALEILGKYDECIGFSREVIDLARQLGQKSLEGKTLFVMGRVYIGMNRREEGLKYFEQAIRLLENTDDVREMANLSTTYGEQMTLLMDIGSLTKAIDTGYRREALIRRMSELSQPPAGYIDQQYGYLYAKMAFLLQKEGKKREASECYRKYQATDFSNSIVGKNAGVPYLLVANRCHEALELNDACFSAFTNDTVNYTYLILLDYSAQANRGLGRYNLADAYMQRYTVVQDSIYTHEKKSQAQELATLFELSEKELQLSEVRGVAERRIILFVGSCVVMALLLVLVWIIGLHLRKTRRRNRIAAKQIDELLEQREELRKAFALFTDAGQAKNNSLEIRVQEKNTEKSFNEETSGTSDKKTSIDYAIFMKLENAIVQGKLFLQPKFGRDELLRVTNINKNDLGRLLRKYADTNSISDYLNRLRVEYSVKLMKEKTHLSIDAIAGEASFNSRSTFYRAFYKVFGMTPTQYMKAN